MQPIRAKISGETCSVMVVRPPSHVGDQVLVRAYKPADADDQTDHLVGFKVTGKDELAGETRWHLEEMQPE